jgi:hypothetical protein
VGQMEGHRSIGICVIPIAACSSQNKGINPLKNPAGTSIIAKLETICPGRGETGAAL